MQYLACWLYVVQRLKVSGSYIRQLSGLRLKVTSVLRLGHSKENQGLFLVVPRILFSSWQNIDRQGREKERTCFSWVINRDEKKNGMI